MKMTWKLPDHPPSEVTQVKDESGRVFTRMSEMSEYWTSEEPGSGRGTYHWSELLLQRGEVEAVDGD
jgi:hypothetical protein